MIDEQRVVIVEVGNDQCSVFGVQRSEVSKVWVFAYFIAKGGRVSPKPTIGELLSERGMDTAQLATRSQLEERVVEAIILGRYTTSPQQRQRIADAFQLTADEVQWAGAVGVDHMYGHGPQFGRSP